MSVRNFARSLLLAALVVPAPRVLAAPDSAALISSLKRTAPATIEFAEARFSSLLREPLIVSGELAYGGPRDFERRVTQPYRETTAIRGDSVSVDREGEIGRASCRERV